MGFQQTRPVTPPPAALPGRAVSARPVPHPALPIQRKPAFPAVPAAFVPQQRAMVAVPPAFTPGRGGVAAPPLQRKAVSPPRLPVPPFGARMVQRFAVDGINFANPSPYVFSSSSAWNATQPIPRGEAKRDGGIGGSGVEVGGVGSYGYVQYLEKTGDGLTGDHQPSGAAVKEAVREALHIALSQPLTRSMARNAYLKAITLVMTDVWHKAYSRTYGGRNTKSQIQMDASDLAAAAINDWQTTVAGLKKEGFDATEIVDIWNELCAARDAFFNTGQAQKGSLW